MKPVLCYVDGNWAYFTTQSLDEQWGDDWDDVPYEHNAEPPYGPWNDVDTWEIIKIAWEGPFESPCANTTNSPWSVKDINSKKVAWLIPIYKNQNCRPIHAGVSLDEFCQLITKAGGEVYFRYGVSKNLTDLLEKAIDLHSGVRNFMESVEKTVRGEV